MRYFPEKYQIVVPNKAYFRRPIKIQCINILGCNLKLAKKKSFDNFCNIISIFYFNW